MKKKTKFNIYNLEDTELMKLVFEDPKTKRPKGVTKKEFNLIRSRLLAPTCVPTDRYVGASAGFNRTEVKIVSAVMKKWQVTAPERVTATCVMLAKLRVQWLLNPAEFFKAVAFRNLLPDIMDITISNIVEKNMGPLSSGKTKLSRDAADEVLKETGVIRRIVVVVPAPPDKFVVVPLVKLTGHNPWTIITLNSTITGTVYSRLEVFDNPDTRSVLTTGVTNTVGSLGSVVKGSCQILISGNCPLPKPLEHPMLTYVD